MADITTLTSPGAANGGADKIALFLEKFSGEVLSAYVENLILNGRVRVKSLTGGAKSYTFGAIGHATAAQHLRGVDKYGEVQEQKIGERLIHLDRPTFNIQFVDEWEEMVNHFDVRQPIAFEMGQAIQEAIEGRLMRLLVQGANKTSPLTDQPTGNIITSANAGTSGSDLALAIKDQAKYLDTNSVPPDGRYVIVKPTQYYNLAEQTDFQDVNIGNGSNGSLKEGTIGRMYGIDILKSNLVPTTNTLGDDAPDYEDNGFVNDYRADASNVVALFGTSRALGMVQMKGLAVSMDEQKLRYGGTFFHGARTVGAGVQRESDCGFVQTA
jgi:hypothetical protein